MSLSEIIIGKLQTQKAKPERVTIWFSQNRQFDLFTFEKWSNFDENRRGTHVVKTPEVGTTLSSHFCLGSAEKVRQVKSWTLLGETKPFKEVEIVVQTESCALSTVHTSYISLSVTFDARFSIKLSYLQNLKTNIRTLPIVGKSYNTPSYNTPQIFILYSLRNTSSRGRRSSK